MKDSYSFDRDAEGLDAAYDKHAEAYDRMCDRCGLEWYRVEADVGMMGGPGADEYMAPCAAGRERRRARPRLRRQPRGRLRRRAAGGAARPASPHPADSCRRRVRRRWRRRYEYMAPCAAGENDVAIAAGYAANVEVASADAQPVALPERLDAPAEVRPRHDDRRRGRPRARRPAGALLKAYPVVLSADGSIKLVIVRGDHRVNEIKLPIGTARDFRPATPEEVSERLGPPGFIGPVGTELPILLDAAVAAAPAADM